MGHPRVYGADHFPQKFHNFAIGSFPCVRGRFFSVKKQVLSQGFIPVCTGQIKLYKHTNVWNTVHPRVYGADTKFLKEIPTVDVLLIPVVSDLYDKVSMYHFFEIYFCG